MKEGFTSLRKLPEGFQEEWNTLRSEVVFTAALDTGRTGEEQGKYLPRRWWGAYESVQIHPRVHELNLPLVRTHINQSSPHSCALGNYATQFSGNSFQTGFSGAISQNGNRSHNGNALSWFKIAKEATL